MQNYVCILYANFITKVALKYVSMPSNGQEKGGKGYQYPISCSEEKGKERVSMIESKHKSI